MRRGVTEPDSDVALEEAIRIFVLTDAKLGVYDPSNPTRVRLPVISFLVEQVEYDEDNRVVHAAGPVVLRAANGDHEMFLRVSVPFNGGALPDFTDYRAAYIVETDASTGACKETAAIANA